ncbi:acyltransferase, putative [Entamoeba invadens IP1]|uniref:Acyltransferase, putative n=1 Tax=Entamoeba invadens IP1 TaxID=370355 RepID=A0A0A1TZH7_ENTIV|nr:acyltransferase, putative [Entamoeba invadens IP1]ELP83954.1 acyltransferase, putative [Entamoeba invadens IP1]|eukprot:XP_004183300.1 acyltransferase, putative [Entamoeba invadens IP1]
MINEWISIIMSNRTIPQFPPHFTVLDSLRGICSVIVIMYHLFETYSTSLLDQKLNHGYLAVDFFFLLSGFVLSFSYEKVKTNFSSIDFIIKRIIRLQPTQLFGTVLGLLTFYSTKSNIFPLVQHTSVFQLFLVFFFSSQMIPIPPQYDIRGYQEMYPLNGPVWTLFFEYIGLLMFVLIIRKLKIQILSVVVFLCSVLLFGISQNFDFFGFTTGRIDSKYKYSIMGGWTLESSHLYIGFVRFSFSFLFGVLLEKVQVEKKFDFFNFSKIEKVENSKSKIEKVEKIQKCEILTKSKIEKVEKFVNGYRLEICSVLMVGVFCMPRLGGETFGALNGLYDVFCVSVVFPLVLLLSTQREGMNEGVEKHKAQIGFEKCANFFGNISYQLYSINYSFIYYQMAWAEKHSENSGMSHFLFAVLMFVLCTAVSYAALKLFDIPMRKRLVDVYLEVCGEIAKAEKQ